MFAEISPELAAELRIEHGEWVDGDQRRAAAIEARVLVTPRMQPLRIDGQPMHQVGLPYHWGY